VVSLSGSQAVRAGTTVGVPNAQLVSVNASVGVMARMIDQLSGTVVWASQYQYEGMDTQSATESVVRALMRSIVAVMPRAETVR
jgi:TolB-like protein